MRLSFMIPILVVLGMGCVVREPAYTTGYVYADYDAYPVYFSDGYYYSYYGGGWYLWSNDQWVVSYQRPRAPVRLTNNHDGYHHTPGRAPGMQVRDHRGETRYRAAPTRGYSPAPARTHTQTRSRGVITRDHRR